jgi:hypothetical protein
MEKRSWPSKIRKDKLWNKRDKRCCSTDWLMHTLHHSPSLVYHSTCNHRSLHHSPHRDTRLDRAPLKPIIVLLQSSSDDPLSSAVVLWNPSTPRSSRCHRIAEHLACHRHKVYAAVYGGARGQRSFRFPRRRVRILTPGARSEAHRPA